MNREAIKGALALKSSLQAAIDSGEIKNRDHLMEIAASHGLTVTRNGIDYAGFQCESGQRLRVRLQFNDRPPKVPRVKGPKPPKIKDGFWIYALIAYSKDGKRKACYVGQAANPPKRFREHFRSQREGRGSYALSSGRRLSKLKFKPLFSLGQQKRKVMPLISKVTGYSERRLPGLKLRIRKTGVNYQDLRACPASLPTGQQQRCRPTQYFFLKWFSRESHLRSSSSRANSCKQRSRRELTPWVDEAHR